MEINIPTTINIKKQNIFKYSLALVLIALDADDGPRVVLVHAGHYRVPVAELALQRAAPHVPDKHQVVHVMTERLYQVEL